jgi:hypothetical protein
MVSLQACRETWASDEGDFEQQTGFPSDYLGVPNDEPEVIVVSCR